MLNNKPQRICFKREKRLQVGCICLIHFVNKSKMFNIGLCELAIVLFYGGCVLINRLIMNPKTTIVLKKGEIQRPFIYLCNSAGKYFSLIHIVNKSSTFNIGLR